MDADGSTLEKSSPPLANTPSVSETEKGFAPYCGLYSLHTAMRSLGRPLSFANLLKPEYVSSHLGSSMEDLIRAARDNGVNAEPMGRMTNAMLRQATCPVILHVKPQLSATKYNHWVLFMGAEGNRAKIYDGKDMKMESLSRLLARWDGTGLLISNESIDRGPMLLAAIQQFSLFAILVMASVLALCRLKGGWLNKSDSRANSLLLSAGQAMIILAIALVAGETYRNLNKEGFLSESEAVAGIQNEYKSKFLAKVTIDEVAREIGRSSTSIIDARWETDFSSGHLPGALNLSPSTTEAVIAKSMEGIPKDHRVVIYCQSPGCPYSEVIAQRLMTVGYSNLVLYRGGWAEWKVSKHAKTGGGR